MDGMNYSRRLQDILSVLPKNVGHLKAEPFEITCPACKAINRTHVERQAATIWQNLLMAFNKYLLCGEALRFRAGYDINHYCQSCGCFIGRQMTLSWCKRQLFRMQRSEEEEEKEMDMQEVDVMRKRWQHFHRIDKQDLDKNFNCYSKSKETTV